MASTPSAFIIKTKRRDGKVAQRKHGKVTKEEKAIVAEIVASQDGVVSSEQVTGLALTLNRTTEAIKTAIKEAQDKFLGRADRYLDLHLEAVEKAVGTNDPKGLDAAIKGSQWAIEHMSKDGQSIVEKKNTESSGVKVLIGVQVGGLNEPAQQ